MLCGERIDYFIQIPEGQDPTVGLVWEIGPKIARRIDVTHSELGVHGPAGGKDILATLQNRFPGSTFYKLCLGPGEYFPCMARPNSSSLNDSPGNNPDESEPILHARTNTTGQLDALIRQLEQICRVVHPENGNLQAYGHEIRNVLILASTEVEALWKTVLKANGTNGKSTKDYVKLSIPMKLPEYRVSFPYYPWLEPIAPFENWVPSETPSQDLGWYAAYNAVKHDRESNFAKATLLSAFQAVTACFVLLCAQYGWDFALRGDAATRAFLRLIGVPKWHPSEVYVPPYGTTSKPKYYSF